MSACLAPRVLADAFDCQLLSLCILLLLCRPCPCSGLILELMELMFICAHCHQRPAVAQAGPYGWGRHQSAVGPAGVQAASQQTLLSQMAQQAQLVLAWRRPEGQEPLAGRGCWQSPNCLHNCPPPQAPARINALGSSVVGEPSPDFGRLRKSKASPNAERTGQRSGSGHPGRIRARQWPGGGGGARCGGRGGAGRGGALPAHPEGISF